MKIKPSSQYWSLHTHSHFSDGDALPSVERIVARAKELNYPGIGLTDHGNMAGSVTLYKEAQRHGLKPFPGSELYYVPDLAQHKADRAKKDGVTASRFHMGVHAFTSEGYENLVRLSTETHRQHFHKPIADGRLLSALAQDSLLGGIAVSTGCHFGWAVQQLIKHGPGAVKQWFATLESWFPGAVYVEAQQHEIEHVDHPGWTDARVSQEMYEIATEMGLPMIITQDSHYITADERPIHETLKMLSSWSDTPDDATFPGDGFHMVDDDWMREHHAPHVFEAGVAGLKDLLDRHTLEIPVLDDYSYSVPNTIEDPAGEMKRRVDTFLVERDLPIEYVEKAYEEMDVINASGMAAYMMLVAEITDYCQSQKWLYQTRGSAAGSLVAWALGITQVDPIHWDLRFERFLSKDRTKPPDIDLDIQYDKRQDLIDWLRTRYSVTSIGTWSALSMAPDEEFEGKGSIMVKYYQMQAKKDGPSEWHMVPKADRDRLYALDRQDAYTGMGKNAAGVIITNNPRDVERLVPMAHSSSQPEGVSQYVHGQIEMLGMVKMDILGSKTLTVLARAGELIGEHIVDLLPIERETSKMRSSDKAGVLHSGKVYKEISKGLTAGVFQLEGWTTRKGCQEVKPTTVHDLISIMALYRPAVIESGSTAAYIARKHRLQAIPQMHPIIMETTKKTNGILLFQEQVIDLLRALDMEADDLTAFLKAVKASNKNIGNAQQVIDGYMPWIEREARRRGFTDPDWFWLQNAFAAFGGYSFNRAHSTIYGLTAWRCAYLAHHYPLEFHTALLDVASEGTDRKKETRYVTAARARQLRVSKPAINISGVGYTLDRRGGLIRRGLSSVKGVGQVAAQELVDKRPAEGYESLDDLLGRVVPRRCTGGTGYLAQQKRSRKKPLDHAPESPRDLTGNLKALYEAEVLDPIIDDDHYERMQTEYVQRLREALA